MNTVRYLRQYLRSHQGHMVHVMTSNEGRVNGIIHNVGPRSVWMVTPAAGGKEATDHIVRFENVRGYAAKVDI